MELNKFRMRVADEFKSIKLSSKNAYAFGVLDNGFLIDLAVNERELVPLLLNRNTSRLIICSDSSKCCGFDLRNEIPLFQNPPTIDAVHMFAFTELKRDYGSYTSSIKYGLSANNRMIGNMDKLFRGNGINSVVRNMSLGVKDDGTLLRLGILIVGYENMFLCLTESQACVITPFELVKVHDCNRDIDVHDFCILVSKLFRLNPKDVEEAL